MYSCPICYLDIFLPQIIGTPHFYTEVYNLQAPKDQLQIFTYEAEKWEFQEAFSDLDECSSIIEIGCGKGAFLNKIKSAVPISIGVEYNEEAVISARNCGLIVYNLNQVSCIQRKSFDCAVSFHVLEHVDDPVKFFQDLVAFLKDDGKICISVPNQDGPIKYIEPCIQNMPPHHATRWHKKTIEQLSQKLNLKIEKITYEPLALINRDYYSFYWINHKIKSNNLLHCCLKRGLTVILECFFRSLQILGFKYFPLLKGQSIYVVMRKNGFRPKVLSMDSPTVRNEG